MKPLYGPGSSLIVLAPNPVLSGVAEPVSFPDDGPKVRAIVSDLKRAMIDSATGGRPAAGLAAPQLGLPYRVFTLVSSHPGEVVSANAYVNPVIRAESGQKEWDLEGCLSLPPDLLVWVERPVMVHVEYFNEFGRMIRTKLEGRVARCFQHELDHLNGVLLTDHEATPPGQSVTSSIPDFSPYPAP